MGYENTLAIAAAPISLAEKLAWHRFDFKRIPPLSMLDVWQRAILLFDLDVAETFLLELPEGVSFFGEKQASIADIITGYSLEYFTKAFADEVPDSVFDAPSEHVSI